MLKVRWLLLLLQLRGHSTLLCPCRWTQMRKHFAHPLPCVKWSKSGGQNQKTEHTDFRAFHLAVCFRKLFVKFRFLFHVWCISPNSTENASRFPWKKFCFTCKHDSKELQVQKLCCSPLTSNVRFSRQIYAAGHMYCIPMILTDVPTSD